MLRLLTIAVFVLVLPASAAAQVTPGQTPAPAPVKLSTAQAKLLWATVNICDTKDHPDTIGVAASMPVIKKATRFYMRFRLQYRDDSARAFKWVPGPNADSGWSLVDPRRGKARRAGYDFTLVPTQDRAHVVRAVVSFQWRRGRELLLSARRLTTIGHTRTKAADPKGFSAAFCTIE